MTLAFDFHPEAQAEFAADVDWYDARQADADADAALRGGGPCRRRRCRR